MNEPDPIDRVIDRVARDLTDADPPGDFRVRVIARLPDSRPRQPWWQYAALIGGGMAVGMLITVLGPMGPIGPQGPEGPTGPNVRVGPMGPLGPNRAVTPVSSGGPLRAPRSDSNVGTMLGPMGPTGPTSEEPFFPRLSIEELSISPIVVGPISLSPIDSRAGGRQK